MIDELIKKYENKIEQLYLQELDNDEQTFLWELQAQRKVCEEIITDLKKLKGKVREELYGKMLSESEYKGAYERLIGNNDTPIKEIGD